MRANTTQAYSQVQMMTAKYDQVSDTDALLAQAKAKADTAHAQVAVAKAERDQAALEHSYTKIYAPVDGTVSRKTVEVGQMTALGQGIAELVPAEAPWVTANFKETQLTHMKPGQPVKLEVDSYPGSRPARRGAEPLWRHRRSLRAAAAGQRHRQLHQDRPAAPGAHQDHRPAAGGHPPPRSQRRRHGRYS